MRRVLSTVAVLFASACLHAADLPAPVKTDFTQHDFYKASLEYDKRTLSGAYLKSGKHDERYDPQVVEFLDALAVRFNNARVDFVYVQASDTENGPMMRRMYDPVASQCQDPLFLYGKAVINKDTKITSEYHRLINQLLPDLLHGEYPHIRKMAGIQKWLSFPHPSHTQELKDQYTQRMLTESAAYLLEPMEAPIERRLKAKFLLDEFDGMKSAQRETILRIVENAPQCDPWIRLMIRGVHEYKRAWESRGGGFAAGVTEQGWKGFHEHLPIARKALEAAYRLEPTYPESAYKMIEVAMSLGSNDCDTRDWFDRAIAAQLDYMPAWKAYIWAIQPRWGGSHKEMYALGKEALNTGRFDTHVPHFLLHAVRAIKQDEYPDDESYDLTENVWLDVKQVFDGYRRKPAPGLSLSRWRANELGYASWCQQYDVCLAILEDRKINIENETLYSYNIKREDLLIESRAMTSDKSPEMRRARRLEESGKYLQAARLYKRVAKDLDSGHIAWPFVNQKAYNCEITAKINSGVRVDLALKIPDPLTFWSEPEKRAWKQTDEYVEYSTARPAWAMLQNNCPVPRDMRIQFDWYYSNPGNHSLLCRIGIEKRSISDGGFLGLWIDMNKNLVQVGTSKYRIPGSLVEKPQIDLTPDTWHTWVIERRGTTINVEFDGKKIIQNLKDSRLDSDSPALLFYTNSTTGGYTMRIRNLSLEALGE